MIFNTNWLKRLHFRYSKHDIEIANLHKDTVHLLTALATINYNTKTQITFVHSKYSETYMQLFIEVRSKC